MVKRDMKKALGASLKAEEQAVKSRFEKAKTVTRKSAPVSREQPPQPEATGQTVNDNFNIPDGDNELLSRIERRCRKAGINADRREVLRAGLDALDSMQTRELKRFFARLPRAKTGRSGRELHLSVVQRAGTVELRRPFRNKRLLFTRQVIIGRTVATISAGKFNLLNSCARGLTSALPLQTG